jgi:hypothetical protein
MKGVMAPTEQRQLAASIDSLIRWRKIADAIRKLIDDWNEEQNRMQGEPDPPAATGVEARVCQDIAARQRLGIAKYGVTVAESQDDMLRHAYEEALDLSVYLKSEIERRQRPQ